MENQKIKLELINQQEVLGQDFKVYGTFENPLFLAKDVAEWIDYSKSNGKYKVSQMLAPLDEEEKGVYNVDTLGGVQKMWFVTEDGLYEILMLSRKPVAKQFKKEIKKILKELRLHGTYSIMDSYMIDDRVKRAERWIEEEQERIRLALQVEEMKPKVAYVDKVLESKDAMITTQIAKAYGLSARKFNELLNDLGVQYKANGQWVLYAEYQNLGYMSDETITYQKSNGEIGTKLVSKWTQKGRYFLYELLKDCDILPIK